ncbi:MAG: J domain-containing protein [Alphaproteobacteria bacterium]
MTRANKQSYTIPCSSALRDAIGALAERRGVNAGDLARSVMLVVPEAVVAAHPDPGEPGPRDRETVILKSGPSEGRPWRRKPRLQVRMSPGLSIPFIRRALGLALAMDRGDIPIRVGAEPPPPPDPQTDLEAIERLRAIVEVLSFQPLEGGVKTRTEALHVLGYPPGAYPDDRAVRARYRMLATVHHPDSPFGNHDRMSQLNAAVALLRHFAA